MNNERLKDEYVSYANQVVTRIAYEHLICISLYCYIKSFTAQIIICYDLRSNRLFKI